MDLVEAAFVPHNANVCQSLRALLHVHVPMTQYHNKRLFKPTFAPGPLVCPITRPDHQPEGVLALERVSLYEDTQVPLAMTALTLLDVS